MFKKNTRKRLLAGALRCWRAALSLGWQRPLGGRAQPGTGLGKRRRCGGNGRVFAGDGGDRAGSDGRAVSRAADLPVGRGDPKPGGTGRQLRWRRMGTGGGSDGRAEAEMRRPVLCTPPVRDLPAPAAGQGTDRSAERGKDEGGGERCPLSQSLTALPALPQGEPRNKPLTGSVRLPAARCRSSPSRGAKCNRKRTEDALSVKA